MERSLSAADVHLSDPALWSASLEVREETFAALREERPVSFHEEIEVPFLPRDPGFWALHEGPQRAPGAARDLGGRLRGGGADRGGGDRAPVHPRDPLPPHRYGRHRDPGPEDPALRSALSSCERLVRSVLGAGTLVRMDLDEAVARLWLDASAVEPVLLNLAVSEPVRSAGGQVRVTSAPGEGTTFRILLPLA